MTIVTNQTVSAMGNVGWCSGSNGLSMFPALHNRMKEFSQTETTKLGALSCSRKHCRFRRRECDIELRIVKCPIDST